MAKKKHQTRGEYLKERRKENAKILAGTVITEWEKGGRTVTVDAVPGPFTRSAMRRKRHQEKYRRKRVEGADPRTHVSAYTKTPLKVRRVARRFHNHLAKQSRRRNR
jgi:hypothetical protein